MHVKITERPRTVTVVRDGQTHTGRWHECVGNDGQLYDTHGDFNLLRAALTAWDGDNEFELTDEELADRGGGWWAP